MNRTGPFWHDRFKCKIIEQARNPVSYYINLSLYIGYKRVAKGLDTDLRDSKYNTFRMMVEEDYMPPVKITFHPYFFALGRDHAERLAAFGSYEKEYRKRLFKKRIPILIPAV